MSSSLQPLTIHGLADGNIPNSLKGAILEGLKLPYEVTLWEHGSAPNGVLGPAYTKINPNGRVPALQDPNTGVVVWESGAIIDYLFRTYDHTSTIGPAPSPQDKENFVLLTGLSVTTGNLYFFKMQKPEDAGIAVAHYEAGLQKYYALTEERLATTGAFILEKGFSASDMHYFPWLVIGTELGMTFDQYPHIERYVKTCQALPVIVAAIEKIASGKKV